MLNNNKNNNENQENDRIKKGRIRWWVLIL